MTMDRQKKYAEIRELARLRELGILTEKEFEAEKKKLLDMHTAKPVQKKRSAPPAASGRTSSPQPASGPPSRQHAPREEPNRQREAEQPLRQRLPEKEPYSLTPYSQETLDLLPEVHPQKAELDKLDYELLMGNITVYEYDSRKAVLVQSAQTLQVLPQPQPEKKTGKDGKNTVALTVSVLLGLLTLFFIWPTLALLLDSEPHAGGCMGLMTLFTGYGSYLSFKLSLTEITSKKITRMMSLIGLGSLWSVLAFLSFVFTWEIFQGTPELIGCSAVSLPLLALISHYMYKLTRSPESDGETQ